MKIFCFAVENPYNHSILQQLARVPPEYSRTGMTICWNCILTDRVKPEFLEGTICSNDSVCDLSIPRCSQM